MGPKRSGTVSDSAPDPRADYARRLTTHEAERDAARQSSARIGTLRLLTFAAIVGAIAGARVGEGNTELAATVAAVLLAGAFVAELRWHWRVRERERWHEALRRLAHEGILRIERQWQALDESLPYAERLPEPAPADHPNARDLDIVGVASLARLLGPVTSEAGRVRLKQWLLEPSDTADVRSRQEAVRELAERVDVRVTLAARGRLGALPRPQSVEPFLTWAEQPAWMGFGLRLTAFVLPATLLALAAADYYAGWPPFWWIPLLAQGLLLRVNWKRIQSQMTLMEVSGSPLRPYGPQLALLEETSWSTSPLQQMRSTLVGTGEPASRELRRLGRLIDTVHDRRNIFYAVISIVLLLDLHLVAALDRWRARAGSHARRWVESLGTVEAMSALATMAWDHPDWCFPELTTDAPTILRASALGHPLLPPDKCVRNDVELGPPGGFLLVTGSNMSGKSTLLRALGTNAVLARAGGPTCASAMTVPDVRICTSMLIDDSVTAGVSRFMAELLRVRLIVQAADDRSGPPVLYLLDEILNGTNTAERQIAARAVIRHLLASHAIGAVSTHDLTLADTPDLSAAATPVHFREDVVTGPDGRTHLSFDHRLRPGLATTRNALKLLDAVGLGGLVEEK